jgi:toll-interacting protein
MSQYKRQEVMTGPLPEDFLRLGPSSNTTTVLATPGAGGMVAYSSENRNGTVSQTVAYAGPSSGVLSVTVAQARLAKNYGLTRMDPYCRIRVGHHVYETQTAQNGGKNPVWNKTIRWLGLQ